MTGRILLAEDNASLAHVLARFLAGQGLEVVTATSGIATLQSLGRDRIDLLILDLKLPGVSGVEILRKLRGSERWASLPIIVMSGAYKGERYVEAARSLGVHHYLEKPFTQKAFLDAVRSALQVGNAPGKPATLFDLLMEIYRERNQGVLTLATGLRISFISGEPFSFRSRGSREFPSFLMARGKISPGDLQHFVESGSGRLFFTQAGLLTYEELAEESRSFLWKALTEGIAGQGQAEFTAAPLDAESPLVPVSVPRLVYEALREHAPRFDSDGFIARFAPLHPARTPLFFRCANLVTLRREDIDLLQLVNGRRTLREILSKEGPAPAGAPFFHFLLSFGMIEFHRAPVSEAEPDFPQKTLFNRPLEELGSEADAAVDFDDLVEEFSGTIELAVGEQGMAAPLSSDEIGFEQAVQREYTYIQGKNYYELFGLSPSSFSFDGLKEAYFEKTRQYSPDRLMELSGATLTVAQEVLSHYANAYGTLSSVVAKERYDEMLNDGMTVGLDGKQDDRLQARIQFQSGGVFLEMGEFDNAEKAFQEAYHLEPDTPEHSAWLAWAIYRNPANRNSRGAQEKARSLLARSLQSRRSAEAFAFRGLMLLDEGREGLAEGEFLKAVKLDPREVNARRGLQIIEEKREAEKKGLFRKIFG